MFDRAAKPALARGGHPLGVASGLQELGKDEADDLGLRLVNHQPLRGRDVAERQQAAMYLAGTLPGADAVSYAFGDELALELREGQQDVQEYPAHAVRRVEGL